MPGGFAGGMRSRPAPQLFAVPRLAEKEMCAAAEKEAPDFDAADIANMDDIMTSIDQLIEGGSGDTPNASMCLGQTTDLKLPAALLQQASIWGAINPSDPLEGHKPAALFSGKGGQYDTGIAVRPPSVMRERSKFSWRQYVFSRMKILERQKSFERLWHHRYR